MFSYKEIIDFYYRSNYGTFDIYEKNNEYFLALSNNIKDIYYNHLLLVSNTNPTNVKNSKTSIVCITPLSDFYNQEIKNMENIANDIWMIYDLSNKIDKIENDKDYKVDLIGYEYMDEYLESFRQSFVGGVYVDLDPKYLDVEKIFFQENSKFKNLIALCWYKNKPIGQVRASIEAENAFIYALGTKFDNRLGGKPAKIIGNFIIEKCLEYGAKNIFLQTEYKSPLERLYRRHGFKELFLGKYYK